MFIIQRRRFAVTIRYTNVASVKTNVVAKAYHLIEDFSYVVARNF